MSVRRGRRNNKSGLTVQPQRVRGRACLSYLRAKRRARLLLRELRRLERKSGRSMGWNAMSPGISTEGAGGAWSGTTPVLLDTSVRKASVSRDGRLRSSRRNLFLVTLPGSSFSTARVRWVGLKRTALACREAAIALDVMRS